MYVLKSHDEKSGKKEVMALLNELHDNLQHEIDQSSSIDQIEGIGGYIQAVIVLTDNINTLDFRDRYSTWFEGLMIAIDAKERMRKESDLNNDDLELMHTYGLD